MGISPLAGKRAPKEMLVNLSQLRNSYFVNRPDVNINAQRVEFGTSGHRGTSLKTTFNENHILATTMAICDWKSQKGISGPLFIGMDTHALSGPAMETALRVLAANGVYAVMDSKSKYTPTPAISFAILRYNKGKTAGLSDGVIITPSHNPPSDGGFKCNPPEGGPADTDVTGWVEKRANEYLAAGLKGMRTMQIDEAMRSGAVQKVDLMMPYVRALREVVDMDAIAKSGIKIGVDPMGGAAIDYWEPIADEYGLNLTVVNKAVDPQFAFMTVDHDGKIRMDCSSPYAMAGLIGLKDKYDVAFGNDTDVDRHGIVVPSVGLMNPNHYLSVAIWYLFQNRPDWPESAAVGKTTVSSRMIDKIAAGLKRKLYEVPVGFKWFVDGLLTGKLGFGGEESAGASFLRRDGSVWVTEKDGMIMGLLAAEICAKMGRDPGEIYKALTDKIGDFTYQRIDTPITEDQKKGFKTLTPEKIKATTLAGDKITKVETTAAGNGASIGGIKISTDHAWGGKRPSGTELLGKLYAESDKGPDHLKKVQEEAEEIIAQALKG